LVPEDKTVVLGLVTTKSPGLEDQEMLRSRVREASAYVAMERLRISPQCGFSGNVGNTVMSIEQQAAKLRLIVDTARSLWDGP
jgi:5-methyltetrahydropteroyltriglutamate--homocysteine methyltransferase